MHPDGGAQEHLRRYLDAVEGSLHGSGKSEILREIESHAWDRAEAIAAARGAEPGAEDLRAALAELGDPSDLAVSYSGERHLITPKEYGAFWYFTGLLFVIHLSAILVAYLTKTRFDFFPFNVFPETRLSGTRAGFVLASLAVQAFLFDAGLVLMAFFCLRRTVRKIDLPNLTFRVESSRRPSILRAVFSFLVFLLVVLPEFRQSLFVVSAGTDDGGHRVVHALFRPSFSEVAPPLGAFLLLVVAKDLCYAVAGERTWTVALDLGAAVCGAALALWMLSRPDFVGLPADFPLDEARIRFFNDAARSVLSFFLFLWAGLFATRAARRFARLRLLWGEADPSRL